MPQHDPTPDRVLVDEIDALIEQQVTAGPVTTTPETCPNCHDDWHMLPIRKTLLMMRLRYCGCEDCERNLDAYDYSADTSPIICPGSRFHGPLEPLETRVDRAGIIMIDIAELLGEPAAQTPLPPPPPDGCALRFRFPATDTYRRPVWAYRLSRPWRDTDYVVVMHIRRDIDADTGPTTISETVLFRYFPPGTGRPPSRESILIGGTLMSIVDDGSVIDRHGINIELGDNGARHRTDGHIHPDMFAQQITGQMVVAIAE